MTSGEIGTLERYGKQIGGFCNWHISVVSEKVKGEVIARTVAQALAFWMLEDIDTPQVEATFYKRLGEELVVSQQAPVEVKLPSTFYLDKLIKMPIDMVFCDGP